MYVGGWVLAAVLSLLGVLGAGEVYRLARLRDTRPLDLAGQTGAALLPLAIWATSTTPAIDSAWVLLGGAVWIIGVMLVAMRLRSPEERPLGAVAITIFGALYAGGMPAFLLWLRQAPAAPGAWAATWLVFLPLAVTWICDTMAMFGGRIVGGKRLAPRLSPGKTWAGFLSGAVGAALVAPLYGALVLQPAGVHIPTGALIVVGCAIGTLGQLGDLAESLFKREAGQKDSGAFFPGHGGVLDRLDSLYWGIPLTVLVLRLWSAA